MKPANLLRSTPATPYLAAAAALLLVWVAAWFGLLEDRLNTLQDAQAAETQLKNDYRRRAEQTLRAEKLPQELAELRRFSDGIRLPERADVPQLMDTLRQAAAQHSLHLDSFTPQPGGQHNGLSAQTASFSLNGTHNQISGFIRTLAGLPEPLLLSRLHIRNTENGMLQMQAAATLLAAPDTGSAAENAGKETEDAP
ncbi:MAG: type 4a pilus biogenesis protein PilO [Neisseria sp.]|nr:type 4a pilus biogenesis protein PilO [Neisseria sp.]